MCIIACMTTTTTQQTTVKTKPVVTIVGSFDAILPIAIAKYLERHMAGDFQKVQHGHDGSTKETIRRKAR